MFSAICTEYKDCFLFMVSGWWLVVIIYNVQMLILEYRIQKTEIN